MTHTHNVTAVRCPTGAESDVLWVTFSCFLANLGLATLGSQRHFAIFKCHLESRKFHFLSFDKNGVVSCQCNSCWALQNSRKRSFCAIMMIFLPFWATFVVWKPLCDLKTQSLVLKSYLYPFNRYSATGPYMDQKV